MDKFEAYLTVIDPLQVAAVGMAGVLAILFIPKRFLMPIVLMVLPAWQELGRMPDLFPLSALAKATGVISYGVLILAAFFDKSPKRSVSGLVWVYPAMALIGAAYVLNTEDRMLALVVQFQWFLLTLAAIMVVRTITDEASLLRVVKSLMIGVCLALLLPLSAVLLRPGDVKYGRFFPWGSNPNQIGVLFLIGMPFGLFLALRARNLITRGYFVFSSAVAGVMGVLCASRSIVYPGVMLAGILAVPMMKKASVIAVAGILGLFAAGWLASVTEKTDFDRLQSLETGRVETAEEYVREVISQRPIFGLMFSEGEMSRQAEEVGHHAHNAYLDQLYRYGLSLTAPFLIMAGISMLGAAIAWFHRRKLVNDTLFMTLLAAMMWVVYAHGFVNGSILYPTYTWAFLHVMLSVFFITLLFDRVSGRPGLVPGNAVSGIGAAAPAQQDWDYSEYADYGAEASAEEPVEQSA